MLDSNTISFFLRPPLFLVILKLFCTFADEKNVVFRSSGSVTDSACCYSQKIKYQY